MQIAQDSAATSPALGASVADAGAALRSAYPDYKIIRRNGAVVGFEPSKISVAMTKAFLAVNGSQGAGSARIRENGPGRTHQVLPATVRSARSLMPSIMRRCMMKCGSSKAVKLIAASQAGIAPGSPAHQLLQGWLDHQPPGDGAHLDPGRFFAARSNRRREKQSPVAVRSLRASLVANRKLALCLLPGHRSTSARRGPGGAAHKS